MQIQKDHIRHLLRKTARDRFLKRGFKSVSMREISKLSGVSLSNIYNYYPSKDDLLAVVLSPLLEAMKEMLDNHNKEENLSLDVFSSEDCCYKSMQSVMGIITRYRKELKLLFFKTQGSRFNDYCEWWIQESTAVGMEYMEKMKERHNDLQIHISPFFIHFTCSWWINMMKEMVLHEELSKDEIECFIKEYILFNTGGWKKLMNV